MASCKVVRSAKMTRINDGYAGQVKANLRQGYGVCTYQNSFFVYEGQWEKGVKQGKGKLQFKDGSYYEGDFSNGEITGEGIRYWASTGNRYSGMFENGEMCGLGRMEYGNGNVYDGAWMDNKQHGQGMLMQTDGETYTGSFYYHKRHGEGKYSYSDGRLYKGGWINNQKHGHGSMTWSDGSVYEGQWRCGEMHGEGALTHSSQIYYQGIWNNGRPMDEPASIYVVNEDDEIVLDEAEMTFTLNIECRTSGDEPSVESGRCLAVRAGVNLAPPPEKSVRITPSRSSTLNPMRTESSSNLKDVNKDEINAETSKICDDDPVKKNTTNTPFGFAVEPYPLLTKLSQSAETITGDFPSNSTTPVSTGTMKEGLTTPTQLSPASGVGGSNLTTLGTPVKSFRDAVKLVNESMLTPSPHYDHIPVAFQRTVNGKVSFANLVLPVIGNEVHPPTNCGQAPPESPEATENKSTNRKKGQDDGGGSGNKRRRGARGGGGGGGNKVQSQQLEEKTEETVQEVLYKAGEYVVIIEDVTENPFLDYRLKPIFLRFKLPVSVKKTKSSRGANR